MKTVAPIIFLTLTLLLPAGLSFAAGSDSRKDMSTVRRGNYEEFKAEREQRNRERKYEEKKAAREKKRAKRERAYKDREFEREDANDYHVRTLGRSCVYGTDGKLIFKPRGVDCNATGSNDDQSQELEDRAQRGVPAGLAPDRPKKKSRRNRNKSKGRCVYSGGRLVFAPADADCTK